MKNPRDPRHLKRIERMQQLFSIGFQNTKAGASLAPVTDHLSDLDAAIQTAAPEWPLDKISKIDLAVLRLAAYELMVAKDQPVKVVIDEAIELAKEFGNVNSPQFVNGVLGTIYKSITEPKKEKI